MKLKYHRSARQKQLSAPSRVFYMADYGFFLTARLSPDSHMGDKAVRPAYKSTLYHMFISHG